MSKWRKGKHNALWDEHRLDVGELGALATWGRGTEWYYTGPGCYSANINEKPCRSEEVAQRAAVRWLRKACKQAEKKIGA